MTRRLAANPGLKSRFPRTFGFDDYAADELMAIADGMMRDEALELDADARAALMGVFERMAAVHDRENGNGRAVRNLLERAKRAQALRLMELGGKRTKEELTLLTEDDFMDSLAELRPAGAPGGHPGGDGGEGEGDEYPVALAPA